MAGHLLGIHPFDQPNVQESKDNTARVLESIQSTGRLPKQATATAAQAAAQLKRQCRPGAYVAILAYTTPSSKMEQAIRALRKALVSHHHVTTTAGYGPRYLHSTGQLHKGGPKSGIFLQLVDPMTPDLRIPGKPFTFRTLAQAQATGDIQALHAHERKAIVLPLGKNPIATIQALTKAPRPTHAGSSSHKTAHQEHARPQKVGCPPFPTFASTGTAKPWAEAAAEFVLEVGKEAVRANGRFFIALSGGTTPETLYRVLTSPAFADRFDWSRTTFFFSDERCVPPDDPRSNYALAKQSSVHPAENYALTGLSDGRGIQ